MATHKVFDHHRRESRRLVLLSPEALEAVRRAFDEAEAGDGRARQEEEALAHCLDSLPPRSAELIGLRYTKGAGVADLADLLGTTPAAIYQQLSRLRSALSECIRRRIAESGLSTTPPVTQLRTRS